MDHKKYEVKKSTFIDTSTPFTTKEKLKVALLIWTVPFRLLIAAVFLLLFALTSLIVTAGWPTDKPLSGWRAALMRPACSVGLVCSYLMGFHVKVKGWENYQKAMKDGVRIALFNHVSYADAFLLVGLLKCSGLSKESNKNLPILGTCIRGLQNIYLPDKRQIVQTGKPKEAAASGSVSKLIADRAEDKRWPMLALAPEGTCGNGRCLLKFRTGAFVSGHPVLPILLKYDQSSINPAWTIMNEGVHFLRLMCQFKNEVEVRFLPAYIPSDAEKANPQLYCDSVRMLMAREMGVPLSEDSYNEFHALSKLGVQLLADGKTVVAPDGVIDEDGCVDLTQILDKKIS